MVNYIDQLVIAQKSFDEYKANVEFESKKQLLLTKIKICLNLKRFERKKFERMPKDFQPYYPIHAMIYNYNIMLNKYCNDLLALCDNKYNWNRA